MRGAAFFLILAMTLSADGVTAGRLTVESPWIRAAPPGAMMLAGYAILRNSGDAPVIVQGATSAAFGDVSLHETVEVGGVERMRALGAVEIAPGADVVLAPGGKHLMLMRPAQATESGTVVKIHFDTNDPAGADADFVVRDDAPPVH
jgi:copper(I)-binding protein